MPYLTPDSPQSISTLLIGIPDSLLLDFTGALVELWEENNWEQFGVLTVSQVTDLFSTAYSTIVINSSSSQVFLYLEGGGSVLYLTDDSGNFLTT